VFIVWPIGGFIVGYFASIITGKILKTQSA